MKVKEKDLFKIKRVVMRKKEVIGVLISDKGFHYHYELISLSGESSFVKESDILEVRIVRNIPKKIREKIEALIGERKKLLKKEEELRTKSDEISKEIRKINRHTFEIKSDLEDEYFKEYGLYPQNEFESLILEEVKELSNSHFNDVTIYDDKVMITVSLEENKYADEGLYGLTYFEYDGSMHLYHNKEERVKELVESKYREVYRRGFEFTRKYIDKEGADIFGEVYLGDKNTLIIGLGISIKLDEFSQKNLERVKRVLKLSL